MSKFIARQIQRGNINHIFSTESAPLHKAIITSQNEAASEADREDARTIAIWKLHLKGWGLRKIGTELGIARMTVSRKLDEIKERMEQQLPLLLPRFYKGAPIEMNREERRNQGLKI